MNNSFPEDTFQFEESKIDIKKIVFNYLRYWPWYLISVIIALSLAYVKLRYTQNTYTSKTTIKMLSEEESSTIPDLTSISSIMSSKVNIENEIAMLTSYRIVEKVVKDQYLTQIFYNLGTIATDEVDRVPFKLIVKDSLKSGMYIISFNEIGFRVVNQATDEIYNFKGENTFNKKHELPFEVKLIPTEKRNSDPIRIEIQTVKQATLSLQSRLKVASVGKSSDLLSIRITGAVKSKLERILNSLVEIYAEEGIEEKRLVDKRTVDFIDQRFVSLTKELDTIENYKKEFKQNNQLFDIENNAALEIQKETQTEEELFALENQLLISKMLLNSLEKEGEKDLLPNNIGIENGAINNSLGNYNQQVLEYQKLIKSGGVNNPTVKIGVQALEATRNSISKSIKGYIAQLNSGLEKLQKRNTVFKKSVESLPLKEKMYREIQRKQEIKESLFLLLLEKRETSAIKYAVKEPTIKIVDYALTSNVPTSPNRTNIFMVAFVVGLLLPLGVVYLRFLLNTKISTSNDVETIAKEIPVLSSIPLLKDVKQILTEDGDQDRSVLKESFRTLITNIKFIIPKTKDSVGKTLLVTSSVKGEGKTLISYNLASELSNHQNKVILIGADLRNPQLHKYLDIDNVNTGLSSYLNDNDIELSDLEFHHLKETPNLDVLFAGSIPPNPTSLLSTPRFEELLEVLKTKYDYIVIDSAPTLLVSDTLIFGKLVDTTVYVTRSNYTEKNIVEYSKRLIDEKKLNNVGYVVNGVDASKGYGYGYNYNYAYSYGYSYEDDDTKKKKWYHIFKR
ncbi:polysaccharide biosynthesis tyrosine autokinase [Wenyingzhuangia sp. 1_MG-2023]|nr:polysaccharide biosynthesis tyrosine autokinase [Wenyingzhuangia sp. 1_MG-2023]